MRIEKLGLNHKDLLFEPLKNLHYDISEYSFTNLYLFRHSHDHEVIFDKEIWIRGCSYDGNKYLMPIKDFADIDYDYLKEMAGTVDCIFPVPESKLSIFKEEDFEYRFDEGDSDYIYTVEKMSQFPGRHLSGKRNLLKQFISSYSHETLPLTNDRIPDAIRILDQWQIDVGAPPEETDYHSCLEALQRYEEVVLCGEIYYADGDPGGFIIGEEINPEMFVFHFAKGKRMYKGMYQYMYNMFAKHLPEKYKRLNFEQDLGKLALKIAKSSYIPDAMEKKFRIQLKK